MCGFEEVVVEASVTSFEWLRWNIGCFICMFDK